MIKFVHRMTIYRFLLSLVMSVIIGHASALTIDSLRISATLDESRFADGILRATFFADGASAVDYSLTDDSDSVVASGSLPYMRQASGRKLEVDVKNVRKWSDETPYTYTLNISARDKNGSVIATLSRTVGFRIVAVRYGKLYINGLRTNLRGININGLLKDADGKRMLDIVTLLKQNNLNAVRTDILDERWCRLCDEYGIYVCSDVDASGMMKRTDVSSVLCRVANHPCVILWSVRASDDATGSVGALTRFLKSMPDSRPVMRLGVDAASETSDIYFPETLSPKAADTFCNSAYPRHEKPLIIDDIVRAGGNGYGGIDEWVQMMRKYSRFAGFFLSENVFSDLEKVPSPGIVEMRHQLSRVRLTSQAPRVGRLLLCNDNLHKSLTDTSLRWQVVNNGNVVEEGTYLVPDVKADKATGINLKLADLAKAYPAGELFLNVHCVLNKAQGLLPKDYELARSQFVIRDFNGTENVSPISVAAKGKLKNKKTVDFITVGNAHCKVSFDARTGFMCQYNVGGIDLLEQSTSLQPNLWRVPTDNDIAAGAADKYGAWRNPDMQLQDISVTKVDNPSTGSKDICVKSQYVMPAQNVSLSISYTVSETGTVLVEQSASMLPGSTTVAVVPRFGVALEMPERFGSVSFFGRGPLENYSDRKQSQFIGCYSMPVDSAGWHYSRPQENGLHTDMRWIRITDDTGCGLEVKSRKLFSASALHEDMDSNPSHSVRVCLDSAQMGVGDYVNRGDYPETFNDTRAYVRDLDFSFLLCPIMQ